MRKVYTFLLFSLLGVLFSCHQSKYTAPTIDVLTQFSAPIRLNNYEVVISNLLNPTGLLILDSLIVVSEYQNDPMIALYNRAGDSIVRFLRKGRGPGETTNLINISAYNNQNIQAFVDPELLYLYHTDSLRNGNLLPSTSYRLPNQTFTPCVQCGNTDFFYAGKASEKQSRTDTRFCIFNANTNQLETFGEYPSADLAICEFPTDDFSKLTAYQGTPAIKPNYSKAVFIYYYAVGFEIIDLEIPKIEKSVFYQYPDVELSQIPQLKANFVKRNPDSLRGFLDIWCSDNYIYFLYSGKKFSIPDYSLGKYILKYDWNGDPICMYELDHETSCFALDSTETHIYTSRILEEQTEIIRYKID